MFSFKSIDITKLPIKNLIIVFLGIALITSIQTCRVKTVVVNDKGLELQFTQQLQKVYYDKNKLGQKIATQEVLIVSKDKDMEKQLLANSNLKELSNHYKIALSTTLDNIDANYNDGINYSFSKTSEDIKKDNSIDTNKYIKVGTPFNKINKWYSIFGNVREKGIHFDSISFIDSTIINIGWKRKPGLKGYFQKPTKVVESINSNPYTSTININNISFKEKPKRFYETQWFSFILGAGAKSLVDLGVNKYIVK